MKTYYSYNIGNVRQAPWSEDEAGVRAQASRFAAGPKAAMVEVVVLVARYEPNPQPQITEYFHVVATSSQRDA